MKQPSDNVTPADWAFEYRLGLLLLSGKYDEFKAGELPLDLWREWFCHGYEMGLQASKSVANP